MESDVNKTNWGEAFSHQSDFVLLFDDEEFLFADVEVCRVQQSLQRDQTNDLRADHWQVQVLINTINKYYQLQTLSQSIRVQHNHVCYYERRQIYIWKILSNNTSDLSFIIIIIIISGGSGDTALLVLISTF